MLNKTALKAAIKAAFDDESNDPNVPPAAQAARDRIADKLANAIDAFVKSATIQYTTGLIAPPSGGAVTGVFNGQLT